MEFLLREKYRLYENLTECATRKDAVKRLEKVANEWALDLAIKKGGNEEEEKARSQVETIVFGSCYLGVHSPGTDVDLILVFRQKYVSQKEFLQGFVKHVQNEVEGFSEVLSISQAKVPIIKVNLGSI